VDAQTFANRACHTRQSDVKLRRKLSPTVRTRRLPKGPMSSPVCLDSCSLIKCLIMARCLQSSSVVSLSIVKPSFWLIRKRPTEPRS
jgi:hypothetical protein